LFVQAVEKANGSRLIIRNETDEFCSQTLHRPFKIIHNSIQGRIRFSVPKLRYDGKLKTRLETKLSRLSKVQSVKASSVTANVLICFDAENLSESALCEILENELSSLEDDHETGLVSMAPLSLSENRDPHWHLLEKEDVLAHWKVRLKSGLGDKALERRTQKYGQNRIHVAHVRTPVEILRGQFTSLPILLLMGSAGISFVTAAAVEGGVILSLIAANAFIGYRTEMAAERAASLLENTSLSTVSVLRRKVLEKIAPEFLVPGDLVWLKEGMSVPADARLIETQGLTLDESALTGESLPVVKSAKALRTGVSAIADRNNMVYRGTLVTGGSGFAVVVNTGARTELGRIQNLVNNTKNSETPLQRQTNQLTNVLIYASLAMGAGMVGISMLYGFGFVETLQLSLSMTIAAIPEGLPVLVTITLAQSANKMRKRNVLVRNLDAIETLGATQIICLDKTGTLTQNLMSVVSLFVGMQEWDWKNDLTRIISDLNLPSNEDLLRLLHVSVLCNDTVINTQLGPHPKLKVSPTEKSLVEMALNAELDVVRLRANNPLIKTDYRTEDKSYMRTVHEGQNGVRLVAVKGSPEQVLKLCTKQIKAGKKVLLTKAARKAILEQNEKMGLSALRVLGMAYSESKDDESEAELVWLGLVGMKDVERVGARDLIRSLHEAGIKPVMITGDQSATACALAHSLGFAPDGKLEVCDFGDLKLMSDEELEKHSLRAHVFSRVAPSEKLKIVQILKSKSKIVAMVGDGINDTPALKASHIGVAMGKRGADVAREVANVVIMDDNLRTLLPAIERGRTSYDSIKKAILFLLATNFSETLLMIGAGSVGLGQALNPLQILWINLISDLFPALALAMEPPDAKVLKRGPHNPNARIMDRTDFKRISSEAGLMAGLALVAFGAGTSRYGRGPRAQTMAFVTLTSAQLLHTFSSRSVEHSVFRSAKLPANKFIALSVFTGFALQCIPLAIPGVRGLFGLRPLALVDWALCGALAATNFVLNEAYRGVFRHKTSVINMARHPEQSEG